MVEYEDILSQIKELLKDHPQGLNIRSISREININRMSVAKYLEVLTARGMVDFRVVGNSKIFFLAQQVPLSTLFRFSSNLIIVLNQHLQIIQINDAFLKYANASKQDIINSKLDETGLSLTDNTEMISTASDVLRGNEKTIELNIKNEDGNYFFSVNLIPIVFEDLTPGIILIYEDITKRKKTEIALKRSKEKYETLFNCLNDAVVITDMKGHFLEVNDTFVDRFGYSREELLLKDFRNEILEIAESYKQIKNRSEELIKKGFVLFDTVLTTRNGTQIPHEISCRIIDFMGEKAVICIGHDIRERNRTDDAFKESEIMYRKIFENSGVATTVISEDGSIISANTGWENTVGLSKEEILGRSFREFVHKKDVEQMLKYHQIRRVNPNLAPNNYEFRLLDSDGDVHECLLNIRMIPGTKNSIASFIDVTDYICKIESLKKREKAYIEFLDNLRLPIFETGVYGNITYLNRAAMTKTGYNDEDIRKGLHFKQLLAPENHDSAVKSRNECTGGRPVKNLKLTGLRKDGTTMPVILSSIPLYEDNKFSGTRGYFVDENG